jgi:hypothetical protein
MIKIKFVCRKIHVPKIHFILKSHQIKGFVNNVLRIVNARIALGWIIIVSVVMKKVSLINYNTMYSN